MEALIAANDGYVSVRSIAECQSDCRQGHAKSRFGTLCKLPVMAVLGESCDVEMYPTHSILSGGTLATEYLGRFTRGKQLERDS